MGNNYFYAALRNGAVRLVSGSAEEAEKELLSFPYKKAELLLRLRVRNGFVSFFFGIMVMILYVLEMNQINSMC